MGIFADRLRYWIKSKGWSDAETARRLELQPQRLANYLAGRHQPDLETVARICATLGLSPNFLLGFEPEEPSSPKKMLIAAINIQLESLDAGKLSLVSNIIGQVASHDPSPSE